MNHDYCLKKLAIIGASYLQVPLIDKAKEFGIETHVFAWENGDVGESIADFFYPISIRDKDTILNKCELIGIDGVVSIASDLASITVNYIADRMELCGNPVSSSSLTTNKYLMRRALKESMFVNPRFTLANYDGGWNTDGFIFPVIVKPTDRSGSRGVTKVYDESKIGAAVSSAISESFEGKAIIEEYLQGDEYSVESISFNGLHNILAVTKKYTTGEPHFVEIGHMQPSGLESAVIKRIEQMVMDALDILGVKNGASHSEIKIDSNGNISVVEIGARMGGDFIGSDLVILSTGVDYVKAVIDVSLGYAPDLMPVDHYDCPVRVKYILSDSDVREYEYIKEKCPGRILKTVGYNPDRISSIKDSSERNAGVYIYI